MTWSFSLAFFLFIPLVVFAIYVLLFKTKKKGTLRYSFLGLISKNHFSLRASLAFLPSLLKGIAFVFVILALARPQSVKERSEQNVKGIDIMIVMDISLSMLVEDMGSQITRLDASRKVVSDFIKGRTSDRIGLIVFSGESFTRIPLTLDYNLILKVLSQIKPIRSIKQGTAIGVALANASARLKHSPPESRVIVFLTDGENNAGFIDPDVALQIAQRNKIKVYTIGLGSVSGQAPITYEDIDSFGNTVLRRVYVDSRINKDLMKKMAQKTNGEFFMAKNLKNLEDIFFRIDQLEKQDVKVNKWMEYKEHFSEFLQIGVILYFLSLILSTTVFFRGV